MRPTSTPSWPRATSTATIAALKSDQDRALPRSAELLNAEDRARPRGHRRATAAKAFHKAKRASRRRSAHALAQVKGQIANYIARPEAAAAGGVATTTCSQRPGRSTASRHLRRTRDANIAIRAALTYLGVPYVWGGASRSAWTARAWSCWPTQAAGIYLPHYSGAMYADTERVPLVRHPAR